MSLKKASKVERISISVEKQLLDRFETFLSANNFPTRSEAIKNLMRQALVQEEWQKGSDVAATISLIFDHHKGNVVNKLLDTQHEFDSLIVCTQHVHLDHHNCMEIIVVRGKAEDIRKLSSNLKAIKGLKHNSLMMATTGHGVE